jgi:serum/glucocorticoid-regulated kinase 2
MEAQQDAKKEPLSLSSFLLLAVLGKGTYAKVLLVKKKDTGQVFALKSLKKEMILKRSTNQHIRNERAILVT